MCNGNYAEASLNYINAQLAALWGNSKSCNEKEGPGKPGDDVAMRDIALREFHGPQAKFHAVFEAPRIEFLCNHELLLYLEVKEGRYEAQRSNISVAGVTLAVRFSYEVEEDVLAKVKGPNSLISILAIKPASVALISEKCQSRPDDNNIDFETLFQVVKTYYLPTLTADLLKLFVMPVQASDKTKRTIDHTLSTSSILSRDVLFGVNVEVINEFFKHRWFAALDANSRKSKKQCDTFPVEYDTVWGCSECEFWPRIMPEPLRIQVICEHEIILFVKADIFIHLAELQNESNLDSVLRNWEVAIIFEASIDKDGRIFLDRSRARIAPNLCSLPYDKPEPLLPEWKEHFKATIIRDYIDLLFTHECHQLYPETRLSPCGGSIICCRPNKLPIVPRPTLPVGTYYPDGKLPIDWANLEDLFVPETSLHGYHQITTVTQAGINAHLVSIWEKAKAILEAPCTAQNDIEKRLTILAHFDSKEDDSTSRLDLPHFVVDFEAPQVELIMAGNRSVYMYFNVKNISLALDDSSAQSFEDLIIAIRFDLQLLNINLKDTGNVTDGSGLAGLRQLILDTDSATFASDRSNFARFANRNDYRAIRALYGIVGKAFVKRYIAAFAKASQHVLYTLPIHSHEHLQNKPKIHARAHAVTDLDFSIVPFRLSPFNGQTFQGSCGPTYHITERNMIVFHGVVGEGYMDLPVEPGPYGSYSEIPPHGTLLLARDVFLDAQIVRPLAKINAFKTILCQFKGVDKSTWDFSLESWLDRGRSVDDCPWTLLRDSKNEIVYKHSHAEDWTYDPDGPGSEGVYSISPSTYNTLTIPKLTKLTKKEGIKVSCSNTINMKYCRHRGAEKSEWSGAVTATWTVDIGLGSHPENGIYVDIGQVSPPIVEITSESGGYPRCRAALETAKTQLEAAFKPIDISAHLSGLNKSFKGVYQGLILSHTNLVLAKPIINAHGDLLLHLVTQQPGKEPSDADGASTEVSNEVPNQTEYVDYTPKERTAEERSRLRAVYAAKGSSNRNLVGSNKSMPISTISSPTVSPVTTSQTLPNTPLQIDTPSASTFEATDSYFSTKSHTSPVIAEKPVKNIDKPVAVVYSEAKEASTIGAGGTPAVAATPVISTLA